MGAEDQRGLVRNLVGFVSFEERLVEAMPAHGIAGLDDFLEGAVLTFAVKQGLARPQAAPHDLGNEEAAAAFGFTYQALAYDIPNRVRKPLPQLLFFVL